MTVSRKFNLHLFSRHDFNLIKVPSLYNCPIKPLVPKLEKWGNFHRFTYQIIIFFFLTLFRWLKHYFLMFSSMGSVTWKKSFHTTLRDALIGATCKEILDCAPTSRRLCDAWPSRHFPIVGAICKVSVRYIDGKTVQNIDSRYWPKIDHKSFNKFTLKTVKNHQKIVGKSVKIG